MGNSYGVFSREDLRVEFKVLARHPEDTTEKRIFPPDYRVLEVIFKGENTLITDEQRRHPWDVLKSGIRKKDTRGNPKVVTDLRELEKFFPMQVELGCGPSIEAGIPPLRHLHEIYYVTDLKRGNFIFGPERDRLLTDMVSNPEEFYRRASLLFAAALTAEPTPFYILLKKLHDQGIVVGPIITNNFDGMCAILD